MKIDIFTHIMPQKVHDFLIKRSTMDPIIHEQTRKIRSLWDLDLRFKIMDKFDELVQVLTLGGLSVETAVKPEDTAELAMRANDEMAELVYKHPDRFVGAVAALPMNDMDATLKETDRAINNLKFRGVEIFSDINGQPLDSPKFRPLYAKMAEYNLPIWLHPVKPPSQPDYPGEKYSKYLACMVFSWPYQTTLAMNRLVYSGILEDYSSLNFITHHCGGMVPHFAERIVGMYDYNEVLLGWGGFDRLLRRPPIEYFRRFYADTVTWGSVPALMSGYSFFGADHLLFGTDMPYDNQLGLRQTRVTINAVEQMNISASDKKRIFEDNARSLLRLPL